MKLRVFVTASLVGLLFACSSTVQATIIINDNFDSYADQAAFQAVWTPSGTSGALTSDVSVSSPNSVRNPANGTNLNFLTFSAGVGTDVFATDANPLVWSYQFYDDPANLPTVGNTLGRSYGQLWGRNSGGALSQILSMGLWNASIPKASNGAVSSVAELRQYYAIRVGFSPGPNWILLDTVNQRSAGWQELKAVIGSTQVEFFVNGTSGGTWSYANSEGAADSTRRESVPA